MEYQSTVFLRPLSSQMAVDLAILANERDIWLQVRNRFPHPYNLEHADAFIASISEQDPLLTFGIFLQDQLCGIISITPLSDIHEASAEIGYFLGKPYWGKGIATAAVGQITQLGFSVLSVERIFAGVFSSNPASMRVLQKNGFVREGIAHRSIRKAGLLLDEHIYALYRPL